MIRFLLVAMILAIVVFRQPLELLAKQSIASLEHQLIMMQQNLNGNQGFLAWEEKIVSLMKMLGMDRLDGNSLNQQLDQVMEAIGQQVGDQRLLHGLHIRRLPFNEGQGNHVTAGSESIQVSSGDPGVSQKEVQTAAHMIQTLSLPILRENVSEPVQPSHVVLFSSKAAYAKALENAGIENDMVKHIVEKTGGITVGSDVWIPLYALQSNGDLANVLTHELTHVALNQKEISDHIPDWVNEGIAWHDGMLALQNIQPRTAKQESALMNRQIRLVAQQGALLPLTVDEQGILQAHYNVEWEDYLAVENLIQQEGIEKFRAFLEDTVKDGVDKSFLNHYQMSINTYENQFYQTLNKG
jgi:hypothetical protein